MYTATSQLNLLNPLMCEAPGVAVAALAPPASAEEASVLSDVGIDGPVCAYGFMYIHGKYSL